jgi:hypothetical protein
VVNDAALIVVELLVGYVKPFGISERLKQGVWKHFRGGRKRCAIYLKPFRICMKLFMHAVKALGRSLKVLGRSAKVLAIGVKLLAGSI